jgi:hypothetical protein
MAAPVLSRGLLDALTNVAGDCQTARWALNTESDPLAVENDGPGRERFEALSSRAWRLAKIEDAIVDLLRVEGVR